VDDEGWWDQKTTEKKSLQQAWRCCAYIQGGPVFWPTLYVTYDALQVKIILHAAIYMLLHLPILSVEAVVCNIYLNSDIDVYIK